MKTIAKSNPLPKCRILIMVFILVPMMAFPQSDAVNIIRGGEIVIGGLITLFSSSKAKNINSSVVESVCVKNKLKDKITFIITRQTEEGEEFRKELVIQKESKEYFYELPKGVYTYEVQLGNQEIFKKGEYRFADKSTLIIDGDIIKNPDE